MSAIPEHLPLFEVEPSIHILERAQAVCNRQRGAVAGESGEGFLDELIAFIIERRGSLIENEDRGVFKKGTRDGNPLALAA